MIACAQSLRKDNKGVKSTLDSCSYVLNCIVAKKQRGQVFILDRIKFCSQFNEYKKDPTSLGRDLPHRTDRNWKEISQRLGWLTWEDFKEVNQDCCLWLGS